MNGTKVCSKCGETKPLDTFKQRSDRPSRHPWCRVCHSQYAAAHHKLWLSGNRDKAAAHVAKWRAKDPKRTRKISAKRSKRQRDELSDNYIKRLLHENADIPRDRCPENLIEAKRAVILAKRELGLYKREDSNGQAT